MAETLVRGSLQTMWCLQTKGAILPGNDGNRATHLSHSKTFFHFSLFVLFSTGQRSCAQFMYMSFERCTNDVVYLSAWKDYAGLVFSNPFYVRAIHLRLISTRLSHPSLTSGHSFSAHEVTEPPPSPHSCSINFNVHHWSRSWSALRFDFKFLRWLLDIGTGKLKLSICFCIEV